LSDETSSQLSLKPIKLNGVQRLLEAGLLCSCLFAVYLVFALFSFDAADPGWSQTGYQMPIHNLGGSVGAYIADLFLSVFGLIAYSLPFVIAITGWLLFQKYHQLLAIDYLTLGLKIIGFILFYLGLTALASMNFSGAFYFSAGGILGDVLASSFLPYFSFAGSTIIFLSFLLTGFVLLTGFSFLAFIDAVGEYSIKALLFLWALPVKIKTKLAQRKIKQNQQTQKLQENEKQNNKDEISKPVIERKTKLVDHAQPEIEQAFKDISLPLTTENENVFTNSNAAVIQQRKEPFVEINDIIGERIEINVQEEVSDDEIAAAFADVEKIDVADDEQTAKAVANIDNLISTDDAVFDKYQGMPSIDLLDRPDKAENPVTQDELELTSRLVEAKLLDFGVQVKVVAVYPGPVITRFELELAPGVKVSKISNLSKDLARSLSAISVRVVEVIPGKSVIGLELPNKHREIVRLSEVIACDDFKNASSPLTMVLGADIAGEPVVVDLGKMPHLLVAGTTGSGKSVGVNTMIVSLLYKSTPEDVRMIMIDPKMLELSVYEGIPHLLTEVVIDMKEAANSLRWCVGEMERRYKLMSALGVRNLKGYNKKVLAAIELGEPLIDPLWHPSDSMDQTAPELEKLPSIVVIIDEFADMMVTVGKKVEELIARIAQKARAAGIHLVLATQRPSVDVITGLIKANIPTRMAFQVSSGLNSRTILDQQGAEQLLGQGDMLYLPPGSGVPTRVHGAFVDDHEVHAVVKDWKERGEPNYIEEIRSGESDLDTLLPGEQAEGGEEELDTLYDEAVAFVTSGRRVSISSIQRKFRIGYNRSARIVEDMENQGVVSPPGNNGAREVLAPPPMADY
jgi:S-DNA-T family DNA segregation ATPase FtsK/SpoIIIE